MSYSKIENSEANGKLNIKVIPIGKHFETAHDRFVKKAFFISKILLTVVANVYFLMMVGLKIQSFQLFTVLSILSFITSIWIITRIVSNRF